MVCWQIRVIGVQPHFFVTFGWQILACKTHHIKKQISDCSLKSVKQTIKILFFLYKMLQESEVMIFIKVLSRGYHYHHHHYIYFECQVCFSFVFDLVWLYFVNPYSESEFNLWIKSPPQIELYMFQATLSRHSSVLKGHKCSLKSFNTFTIDENVFSFLKILWRVKRKSPS